MNLQQVKNNIALCTPYQTELHIAYLCETEENWSQFRTFCKCRICKRRKWSVQFQNINQREKIYQLKSNIIIVSENQIGASVEHPNPSNRDKIIKVLQN